MPKNKNEKVRLIVDANIWISSLMSSEFYERIKIVFDSKYSLMVSERLFRELNRASLKPKVAKRIIREDYEAIVSLLRRRAELIDVHSEVVSCRDPKDDYLLALAKDGNADFLITGDKDLLVMETFGKTKIVSLADFEKDLK